MRRHFQYDEILAIIITGNPGVGKHTITKEISKTKNFKIIDVNQVAKENFLYEKDGDTNDVDTGKLKKIIAKMISEKSLIVGHLAPYVVSDPQVSLAIILRKNPYELIKVYKKRKYKKSKAIENSASEILGIIAYDTMKKFGKKKIVQIDCTKKTIKEIARMISDAMAGKKINEQVDWLYLVLQKNHLEKFFPSN